MTGAAGSEELETGVPMAGSVRASVGASMTGCVSERVELAGSDAELAEDGGISSSMVRIALDLGTASRLACAPQPVSIRAAKYSCQNRSHLVSSSFEIRLRGLRQTVPNGCEYGF